MTEHIHIPLLDEGLSVWRPVLALRVDGGRYVLLRPDDYDEADERWAFAPGSVVEVEPLDTTDGRVLTAVRAVASDRVSA